MTDIVERLRNKWMHSEDDCYAAADEIERLRDQIYESIPKWQANELQREIEQLREDKRNAAMDYLALDAQLEMHLTEIERLKKKCDKQAMILRSLFPDRFPDTYFICGEAGERDQNGMPAKIMVAPAYGVDFAYEYVYNGRVRGPEW